MGLIVRVTGGSLSEVDGCVARGPLPNRSLGRLDSISPASLGEVTCILVQSY